MNSEFNKIGSTPPEPTMSITWCDHRVINILHLRQFNCFLSLLIFHNCRFSSIKNKTCFLLNLKAVIVGHGRRTASNLGGLKFSARKAKDIWRAVWKVAQISHCSLRKVDRIKWISVQLWGPLSPYLHGWSRRGPGSGAPILKILFILGVLSPPNHFWSVHCICRDEFLAVVSMLLLMYTHLVVWVRLLES